MEFLEELTQAETEMQQAALAGNVARVRALSQRRKQLQAKAKLESQQLARNQPPAPRGPEGPQRGEEKRLSEDLRRIESDIARLSATRQNHLAKLASSPDDESLLAVAEDCDNRLTTARRQQQAIEARQAQIAAFHQRQDRIARQQAEAKAAKERTRERERLEKAATATGDRIVNGWRELLSMLVELDTMEDRLKQLAGLKNSCPPVDAAREKIQNATGNCIQFIEPDARTPRETRIAYSEGGRALIPPVTNSRFSVI